MTKTKVVIIGAGPAGLTAAYKLLEQDGSKKYQVTIIESDHQVGGISKTIRYKGNRMDLGGHRFFTKVPEVSTFWNNFVQMDTRQRLSRIYHDEKFFDYPPKLNISTIQQFGYLKTIKIGSSYLRSSLFRKKNTSLENFYINRFGKELYQLFFEKYTEKLWGMHPSRISAEWGAQRVKGLSIATVLKNLITPNSKKETSLIESFQYPQYGPGQMYEKIASEVVRLGGKIISDATVTNVHCQNSKIKHLLYKKDLSCHQISCDLCLSSMPIKSLINSLSNITIPSHITKTATNLPYRHMRTIGVLIKNPNNTLRDCWIYIQDPHIQMGRIQIFNNWSPYLVKNKENLWLGLEYFCGENDDLWRMTDSDFFIMASNELVEIGFTKKENILDFHCEKVPNAYPAYFGSYQNFDSVRKFLDTIPNLYCIGRNGQHHYNNMDHSILTAFEAVKNIKTNHKDKSNIWSVNTEQDYHETKKIS